MLIKKNTFELNFILLNILGELDKAENLAKKALKILPEDSALHFNLANTLGKKGHYENAEEHFKTAITLRPNQALYHTNLGNLSKCCFFSEFYFLFTYTLL